MCCRPTEYGRSLVHLRAGVLQRVRLLLQRTVAVPATLGVFFAANRGWPAPVRLRPGVAAIITAPNAAAATAAIGSTVTASANVNASAASASSASSSAASAASQPG